MCKSMYFDTGTVINWCRALLISLRLVNGGESNWRRIGFTRRAASSSSGRRMISRIDTALLRESDLLWAVANSIKPMWGDAGCPYPNNSNGIFTSHRIDWPFTWPPKKIPKGGRIGDAAHILVLVEMVDILLMAAHRWRDQTFRMWV